MALPLAPEARSARWLRRLELVTVEARGPRRRKGALVLDADGLALKGPLPDGSLVRFRADSLERPFQARNGGFLVRIEGHELVIPARKRTAALEMLTLDEVSRGARQRSPANPAGLRHVERPSPFEHAVLESLLDPEELLLAWLATGTEEELRNPWFGSTHATLHCLLTERRCAFVAVSRECPPRVDWLPPVPMAVTGSAPRVRVRIGERTVMSTEKNAALYGELAPLSALRPAARLRKLACLNHRRGGSPRTGTSPALQLLRAAAEFGDDLAPFAMALLGLEREGAAPQALVGAWLAALHEQHRPSSALADLWADLGGSVTSGEALLGRLALHGAAAEPYAIELHLRVHAERRPGVRQSDALIEADLRLAEHLCQTDRPRQALGLLANDTASLPQLKIEELLPPLSHRAELLRRHSRLAIEAARAAHCPALPALHTFARRWPFDAALQRELAVAARDGHHEFLATRAEALAALLDSPLVAEQRELGGTSVEVPVAPARAFNRAELLSLMPFGAATELTEFIGWLQSSIARTTGPDRGTLEAHVERLEAARPRLESLPGRIALLLGLGKLDVFVSRGGGARGFLAYESPSPCIIIAGPHLAPGAPVELGERELAFALASEATHIRFGETRVTTLEVWLGALDFTRQGLSLAMSALPLLSQVRALGPLQRLAARIPNEPLGAVLSRAEKLLDRARPLLKPRTARAEGNADVLIAAHRFMALRADRVGLICCGDPAAALRTMVALTLESRPTLRARLSGQSGEALRELAHSPVPSERNIAVRAAALLAFWLSEDYASLRSVWLGGQPDVCPP